MNVKPFFPSLKYVLKFRKELLFPHLVITYIHIYTYDLFSFIGIRDWNYFKWGFERKQPEKPLIIFRTEYHLQIKTCLLAELPSLIKHSGKITRGHGRIGVDMLKVCITQHWAPLHDYILFSTLKNNSLLQQQTQLQDRYHLCQENSLLLKKNTRKEKQPLVVKLAEISSDDDLFFKLGRKKRMFLFSIIYF